MDRQLIKLAAHSALLAALLGPGAAAAACSFSNSEPADFADPSDADCNATIFYTESDNTGDNLALGYPVPMPVASQTAVAGFREYASLHARHQDIMTVDPDVRGQVLGQTVAGRDIWIYLLGDADNLDADGQREPAMLVNGGIHAREWQSPESVTEIIETMAEIQDDGWLGSYLRDEANVMIIPVLNVDGLIQTQLYPDRVSGTRGATDPVNQHYPREGRMRRKNLRDPNTGLAIDDDITTTADNQYGVDLNRNSVVGWGQFGSGANGRNSGSPTSIVHRGASAASEPETQALHSAVDLLENFRDLRMYTDVHSFSKIFFRIGTGNARRDAIDQALALTMAAVPANDYRVGATPAPGSDFGTTDSHFGVTYTVPSYTLEIEPLSGNQEYGGTGLSHAGFILPDAEITRVRDEVTDMLLLGFYYMSGPPAVRAIRITDQSDASVAYQAEWQAGQPRTLNVMTNQALVPGNSYDVWLAFDKPMRRRNGSGDVGQYPGQNVALNPTVRLEYDDDSGNPQAISVQSVGWLDTPGGPGVGYMEYQDDAWTGTFTVPAGVAASRNPAVIAVSVSDMAGLALDGDAESAVGWSANRRLGFGHWTGYEDDLNQSGDVGGTDCGFEPFVAGGGSAPTGSRTCAAKQVDGPFSLGQDPGAVNQGGAPWALLGLLLVPLLTRRRMLRA